MYGLRIKGVRGEQCIPMSMCTKRCVFDELSALSGAEGEDCRIELYTKKQRRERKGEILLVKEAEMTLDKEVRVTMRCEDANERIVEVSARDANER